MKVHSSLPSLASKALTKPRMPYSPPLVPIRIFAVDRRRRHGLAVAERRIGDVRGPRRLAGLGIERHQFGVERGEIDLVAIHRDAAIVGPAAIDRDRPHLVLVFPQLFAGLGVERIDVVERGGDVHHAVDDDRRGLHQFAHIGLEDPGDVQAS